MESHLQPARKNCLRLLLAIWPLLAICAAQETGAPPSPSAPAPFTPDQYIQILDTTLTELHKIQGDPQRTTTFLQTLPAAWHVETHGRIFEISTETVRQYVETWRRKQEAEVLDHAFEYVETLRYEADERPVPDFVSAHSLLSNILARREFYDVHGQTWLDRLKQHFTPHQLPARNLAFQQWYGQVHIFILQDVPHGQIVLRIHAAH